MYTSPIKTTDRNVMSVFRAAFPSTKFRAVRVTEFRGPQSLNSYWDSGCRDYWQIVRLSDLQPIASIPQNGTPYDGKNLELSELPAGFALAQHVYSGCNQYGYLHFNAADLVKQLPQESACPAV